MESIGLRISVSSPNTQEYQTLQFETKNRRYIYYSSKHSEIVFQSENYLMLGILPGKKEFRLGIRHGIKSILPVGVGTGDEEFRRRIKNVASVVKY